MKNNLKKTATLALIGAALAFQGAQAQFVPANGDLIFGAEKISNGSAIGNDLEVDLGTINNFTTTAHLSFPNVSSTDLMSVLGAGFGTATNTFWSVAGTTNLSDVGPYFNRATFITLATDPGALSKTGLTTASNAISGIYTGMDTPTSQGLISAPNSNGTGIELAASNSESYSAEEIITSGSFFNFSGTGSTTFGSGVALDLYALNSAGDVNGVRNTPGTDTLLGTFTYTAAGGLVFTGADFGAAVPEPSTYALMAFGAVALFYVGRRRALQS